MRIKLGLDLGSNNLVAVYLRGGELYAHYWSDLGNGNLLPAYIQVAGHDSNRKVVAGMRARVAWERREPGCYRNFKTQLGRDTVSTVSQTSPSTLRADMLLAWLVEAAYQSLLGNEQNTSEVDGIDAVVVTVPHSWDDQQRKLTLQAAQQMNILNLRLVSEPVAVAAYYAFVRKLQHAETVLVCDMGGGTFDVSLTDIYPDRKISVLANGTATNQMGGNFADALLASHVLTRLALGSPSVQDVIAASERSDPLIDMRAVLQAVERARLNLNAAAVRRVIAGYPLDDLEPELVRFRAQQNDQFSQYDLSYTEMLEVLRPLADETEKLIHMVRGLHASAQISGVVLAGGMSRMLMVQEAVARATGFSLNELRNLSGEFDKAIANGAALIANGIIQIDDALPYSVGVVARPYGMSVPKNFILLQKGTHLPCEKRFDIPFRARGQAESQFLAQLAVGETENLEGCRLIDCLLTLPRSNRYQSQSEEDSLYYLSLSVDHDLQMRLTIREQWGQQWGHSIQQRIEWSVPPSD